MTGRGKRLMAVLAAGGLLVIIILLIIALKLAQNKSVGCGYQVIESEYTLDNGYCFTNFQVCGMKDRKLEGRVNESLNKYLYILDGHWFNWETTKQMSNIVHFQSERYLSVEYIFKYDSPFYTRYWHFCVTVDMQTGEVVFLDDLINMDEAFGRLVRKGNILKGTGKSQSYNAAGELVEEDTWDSPEAITADEQTESNNKLFQRADPGYAIRWFEDYTRERLYGAYLEEMGYEGEQLLYSYTTLYHYYFYLEDGEIHFSTGGFQTRTDDIAFWTEYISVDDIEECLKVPKW